VLAVLALKNYNNILKKAKSKEYNLLAFPIQEKLLS